MLAEDATIESYRLEAAHCWLLGGRYGQSGLVKSVIGKISSFMGLSEEETDMTREELERKCESLLLVEDASVRAMTLLAMFQLHYVSKSCGLIASLMSSTETATLIFGPTGQELGGSRNLGDQARLYLNWVMRLKDTDVYDTERESSEHWLGVLSEAAWEVGNTCWARV